MRTADAGLDATGAGAGEAAAKLVRGLGNRALAASGNEGEGVVSATEVAGTAAAANQSADPGGVVAGYGACGEERLERRRFVGERQGDVRRAGTRGRGGPSVGPNNVPNFWSRPKREIVMACLSLDISRCWCGRRWRRCSRAM